jgi:hypothetical protein
MYLVLPGPFCPRYCSPRGGEIEIGLQHQPKVRGISEMPRQPYGSVRTDSPFAAGDFGDATRLDPDFTRQCAGGEIHRNEEFLQQNFAGMDVA